ncbi:MAG: hypothetical protein AABY39_04070 [Nitrospirota bacterium]
MNSIVKNLLMTALIFIACQNDAVAASEKNENKSLLDVNLNGLEKNESRYKWGSDPFFMPGTQKGKEGAAKIDGMTLNGVIHRNGSGIAIINNRIMRKGDAVAGKRLIEILVDRVILSDGDERIELMVEKFSSAP